MKVSGITKQRDFATPPHFERGDEIALTCRKDGRTTRGRFHDFHGGIYYIHHTLAGMVRAYDANDFIVTDGCTA